MRDGAMCVLLFLVLSGGVNIATTTAQGREPAQVKTDEVLYGSLSEIRYKRRALLLTNKNFLVDTRGPARAVLSTISNAQQSARRYVHAPAHNIIGKKLNKYIRAYKSMGSVEDMAEADFIIVFHVMRETPSFIPHRPFVFGEMFVVLNGSAQDPRPRIIWQTKKELTSAEDAVGAFIKDLKSVRGEK